MLLIACRTIVDFAIHNFCTTTCSTNGGDASVFLSSFLLRITLIFFLISGIIYKHRNYAISKKDCAMKMGKVVSKYLFTINEIRVSYVSELDKPNYAYSLCSTAKIKFALVCFLYKLSLSIWLRVSGRHDCFKITQICLFQAFDTTLVSCSGKIFFVTFLSSYGASANHCRGI